MSENHKDHPESRLQYIVKDKPTENGVKLNNVLTGLLLAAALWVGNSVEDLKEAVVILATQQAHGEEAIVELKDNVDYNEKRINVLERLHPEYYTKNNGSM